MRSLSLSTLAVVSFIGLSGTAAQAQSCGDLWYERNAIYKQYGYCFRTSRAIRQFGNAGCQYDNPRDLRMSRGDRARIDRIVREERAMGCRDN